MEHLATFVCSRGVLRSCDCHNQAPLSCHDRMDTDLLDNFAPGASIYVCTESLPRFAREYFPRISAPFVLVSGDSDMSVGSELLADPAIRTMLDSPHLLRWFAQNLAASHGKLHHMPIGMDYHTVMERPGLWCLAPVSAVAQERAVLGILAASPQYQDRFISAYCNFQFNINSRDRQDCLEQLDRSVCHFERERIPRSSTLARQTDCMFVISPQGAGIDCHRTWEALILGSIPIMKRVPVAPLFENLPVVYVEDWRQVNQAFLMERAQEFFTRKFDFSTLFLDHWRRRIRGQRPKPLPPMTLLEFRVFLTRSPV